MREQHEEAVKMHAGLMRPQNAQMSLARKTSVLADQATGKRQLGGNPADYPDCYKRRNAPWGGLLLLLYIVAYVEYFADSSETQSLLYMRFFSLAFFMKAKKNLKNIFLA